MYLNVFLGDLTISHDFTRKQPYNNYPRTKKFRTLNYSGLYEYIIKLSKASLGILNFTDLGFPSELCP